jgi:hypothetical protein
MVPLLILRALTRILAGQPPRLDFWVFAVLGLLTMLLASALLFLFE